jgi:integrase/recombinase XerD
MRHNSQKPDRSAPCDVIASKIEPFMAGLEAASYVANTLCTKRVALRHFVSWRQRLKSRSAGPDESEVAEFMARACRLKPKHRCLASTALLGFLQHLRRRKVITTRATKPPETASLGLTRRYAEFLRNEKGLAELSLRAYLPVVPQLLHYLKKRHGITSLRTLDARVLRAFLFERAQDRSSEYVRLLVTSLRSFVRFLHVQGEIRYDLTAAIPTVRRWAQPGVPKKLTSEEVDRVS